MWRWVALPGRSSSGCLRGALEVLRCSRWISLWSGPCASRHLGDTPVCLPCASRNYLWFRHLHSVFGSSLFPMEWLLGLPEGSRAKRCPGSGPLPVSRVSATHPNPAWHPKQPSLWPPIPILHQTVLRAAPEPHRSTSDSNQRYYGEAPMGLRRNERAVGDAVPPIPLETAKSPNQYITYLESGAYTLSWPFGHGGGQQRGGQLLVKAKKVLHPLALAGEGLGAVA